MAEVGREVPPAPHAPTPGVWPDNAITLAWLGHATVLINFYGVRVLTDPALFPRIGVDTWVGSIGPLRLTASALTAPELPDIDLVLVSHAHFDHLDTPSLAAVPGLPAVVMALEDFGSSAAQTICVRARVALGRIGSNRHTAWRRARASH